MKTYIINSEKSNQSYYRENTTANECRHWIINHLDLSMNWSIHEVPLK